MVFVLGVYAATEWFYPNPRHGLPCNPHKFTAKKMPGYFSDIAVFDQGLIHALGQSLFDLVVGAPENREWNK